MTVIFSFFRFCISIQLLPSTDQSLIFAIGHGSTCLFSISLTHFHILTESQLNCETNYDVFANTTFTKTVVLWITSVYHSKFCIPRTVWAFRPAILFGPRMNVYRATRVPLILFLKSSILRTRSIFISLQPETGIQGVNFIP